MNSREASALSNVLHAERLLLQGLRLTAILEHSDGHPRQVQISVFGIKLPWSRFSNNALRDKWVSYVIPWPRYLDQPHKLIILYNSVWYKRFRIMGKRLVTSRLTTRRTFCSESGCRITCEVICRPGSKLTCTTGVFIKHKLVFFTRSAGPAAAHLTLTDNLRWSEQTGHVIDFCEENACSQSHHHNAILLWVVAAHLYVVNKGF